MCLHLKDRTGGGWDFEVVERSAAMIRENPAITLVASGRGLLDWALSYFLAEGELAAGLCLYLLWSKGG
jgi:hypothetical protein